MHEACDFVLDSSYVSRLHASLLFEQGKWRIKDIDSKGGIHLDSIRLEPQELDTLHDDRTSKREKAWKSFVCRV